MSEDRPPLPAYRLEEQIGYKLRLASQKHLEIFSTLMPDLTPTQFSTLLRLQEAGPLGQNHLGRMAAMDAATTKGVVDRLRAKGLVATTRNATDRRRLDVALTPEGETTLAAAIPVAREISARTADRLSPSDLATLLRLLDRV